MVDDKENQGASASPTACSPSGSSPVPGLAADALRPTGAGHTPGPWVLLPASFSPSIYVMPANAGPDDAAIATVIDRANARLIAAAPTMASALDHTAEALRHAMATFYRYARLHRDKGTEEGDAKACANASMGEEMARALETADAALAKAHGND